MPLIGNGRFYASRQMPVAPGIVANESDPAVTKLAGGGFVAVWVTDRAITVQRYDDAGAYIGAPQFVTPDGSMAFNSKPDVVGLSDGGYVVAWSGPGVGLDDLKMQIFNSEGSARSIVLDVAVETRANQQQISLTALPGGTFAAAWTTNSTPTNSIMARVFDSQGSALTGDIPVALRQFSNAFYPDTTTLLDGRFVVAWSGGADLDGRPETVRAQIFSSAGVPQGPLITVPTPGSTENGVGQVTSLASGGFVITWRQGEFDAPSAAVKAQVYDISGMPVGAQIDVNGALPGGLPAITTLSDGNFAIAWQSKSAAGGSYFEDGEIRARIFDGNGSVVSEELAVNTTTFGAQTAPTLTGYGTGDFAIAWHSFSSASEESVAIRTFLSTLRGSEVAESLVGSAGPDVLVGSGGDDVLSGGANRDIFLFAGDREGFDRITNFSVAQDRIDLNGRAFTSLSENAGNTRLNYSGGTVQIDGITGLNLLRWNALAGAGGTLARTDPSDAATTLSTIGDIRLIFTGAVERAFGAVTLTNANGGVVERFDVGTSNRLTIRDNVLTVDPTRPLDPLTRYILVIPAGAIKVGGIDYGALTTYDFSTRAIAASPQFQLVTSDGLASTVSGSGLVVGTRTGTKDVTVLDTPGQITFDPSFNAGGDRVRLSGAAANYAAQRSGSTILMSDGDSIIAVPVGPASTDIIFADGVRTLLLDAAAGVVRLGGQVMTTTATLITAAAGPATATDAASTRAGALLVSTEGGSFAAIGIESVVGTRSGAEHVTVAKGATLVLDPSFNAGRDTVSLPGDAASYTAMRFGSSIVLTSLTETVTVPVGVVGATVRFDDAARVLVFDTAAQAIKLGSQVFGTTATAVAAPLPPTNVALAAMQDAVGGDFRYSQAGTASPDATITGFARGDSLVLQGDAARYLFSSDEGSIVLSYIGTDGTLRTTTLVGVANPEVYVGSLPMRRPQSASILPASARERLDA